MKNITTFLILSFFCSGCSMFVPRKDNSIFYTLSNHKAYKSGEEAVSSSTKKTICFLMDEIPAYADCPYIVIKTEKNQIVLSENHRWGEPFKDSCGRSIIDLLVDITHDQMKIISSTHEDQSVISCDYRLSVSIDDFIYNKPERNVVLKSSWSLFDYKTKTLVILERYADTVTMESTEYTDIVDGMKLIIQDFATNMAKKLKNIISSTQQISEAL